MEKTIAAPNSNPFKRIYVLPTGVHVVGLCFPLLSGATGVTWVNYGDFRNPRKLAADLFDKGADGGFCDPKNIIKLERRLQAYASSDFGKAQTVPLFSGGWSENMASFRLGDLEIPSGRKLPGLPGLDVPTLLQTGTHSGWMRDVAEPACCSSFMMLMIAAAFAAPGLRLVGVEKGGFGLNLVGGSGTGKSVSLLAGASVFGPHHAATWNTTVAGLEEKAQAFCDLPFTLDSLEDVPREKRGAMLERVSYIIANGMPRLRSKAFDLERAISAKPYRTVVLSTEEDDGTSRSRATGSTVRLIDVFVPPNSGSHFGIVDHFPPDVPPEAKRKWAENFVKGVEAAVARQHGTALPEYVRRLVQHRGRAATLLLEYQQRFLSITAFSEINSDQGRMLIAFARVYAAGRLAIDMKLVPWTEARLRQAIGRCAMSAIRQSADVVQLARRNAKRVLAWLTGPDRRLVEMTAGLTLAEAAAADFIRVQQKKMVWALVTGKVLRRDLGLTKSELTAAMKHLRESGTLVTERKETLVSQYEIQGKRPSFYIIILEH